MASPFNIFRRNQRIMMAVLVGLSMFAFIFFDPSMLRSGGGLPKPMMILLIAGLCGLGMWFVGRNHGKAQEWGLWAALVGAVAAFLFVRSSEPPAAVVTRAGNFTDAQLSQLGQNRFRVNQFVYRAGQLSKSKRPSQGFGSADSRSMLQFALAREEAKRLGIVLNDAAVNRFISEFTEDRLPPADFQKILRELGASEGEMFRLLREELEARLAFEVQAPLYDTWADIDRQSFQMISRPKAPATPEEQWRIFCRLNLKQSLAVVELPVNSFVDLVKDPPVEELQKFFESRKNFPPSPQGDAGFIQPHRSRIGYLAAEFEAFEKQATVPTDDEVKAYYEANKANYRANEATDAREGAETPADAGSPENVVPELPAPDETKSKSKDKPESGDKPDSEDKPASEESKEQPGSQTPDSKEKPSEGDSSSAAAGVNPAVRLVSATQETTDDAKKDDSGKENAGKEDTTKEEAAKPKSTEEPPVAGKPEEENDGQEKSADEKPGDGKSDDENAPLLPPEPAGTAKKPIKYLPLDDDLQARIRETMLRDRAYDLMGVEIEAGLEVMKQHAFKYLETEEKDRPTWTATVREELKSYAAAHNLKYVETGWLSKSELLSPRKDGDDKPDMIGFAVLPTSGGQMAGSVMVADDLFPENRTGATLFFPQRADSRIRDLRYAWWSIEDKPQHTPEWNEEGIQEQVKTGWKYEQSRQMARARAEKLQDLVKADESKDWADVLSGQTVTGEADSEAIVIGLPPRFSWMTTSRSTPSSMSFDDLFSPPRLSFIQGVDQPDNDFMQTIFEKLKVGESAVLPNAGRTAFYLVKVLERDGTDLESDVEGYQTVVDLRSTFLSSQATEMQGFGARPYHLMMMQAFSQQQQAWTKQFDQRYGVVFENTATTAPDGKQKSR